MNLLEKAQLVDVLGRQTFTVVNGINFIKNMMKQEDSKELYEEYKYVIKHLESLSTVVNEMKTEVETEFNETEFSFMKIDENTKNGI